MILEITPEDASTDNTAWSGVIHCTFMTTLVDISGIELAMGTEFKHFSFEAASLYFEESNRDSKIQNNRRLLRKAMIAHDFRFDQDAWWHFDFSNQIWAAELGKPFALYDEINVIEQSD